MHDNSDNSENEQTYLLLYDWKPTKKYSLQVNLTPLDLVMGHKMDGMDVTFLARLRSVLFTYFGGLFLPLDSNLYIYIDSYLSYTIRYVLWSTILVNGQRYGIYAFVCNHQFSKHQPRRPGVMRGVDFCLGGLPLNVRHKINDDI